jgi:hypothetical protein
MKISSVFVFLVRIGKAAAFSGRTLFNLSVFRPGNFHSAKNEGSPLFPVAFLKEWCIF